MNRKIVNILLLLFALFTLYNTLIPFNFQLRAYPLGPLLRSMDWHSFLHRFRHTPITDIAGNILLFMPLGFLIYLWLYQRHARARLLLTGVLGLSFSIVIEFLQLFVRDRITSITDIFNNTMGTISGAIAALICFRLFAPPLKHILKRLIHEQPMTIFLLGMIVLQTIGAVFPFSVSITLSDLKNSIRHMIIIPFDSKTVGFLLLHRTTSLDTQAFHWFKFGDNLLFWSLWGYMVALCYDYYWSVFRHGKWVMLIVGLAPGIMLEFLQIFIVSRYCDINDVVSNWSGVFLGSVIFSIRRIKKRTAIGDPLRDLRGALILYGAFILFSGLKPFDFHFASNDPTRGISLRDLVPFLAYFKKTSIWNIYDLMTSLLYFFPAGAFMGYRLFQARCSWATIYLFTGVAGFFVGLVIEFIQLFSPTRTGDITDALLYGLGGFLGSFCLFYFVTEIRPSLEKRAA